MTTNTLQAIDTLQLRANIRGVGLVTCQVPIRATEADPTSVEIDEAFETAAQALREAFGSINRDVRAAEADQAPQEEQAPAKPKTRTRKAAPAKDTAPEA